MSDVLVVCQANVCRSPLAAAALAAAPAFAGLDVGSAGVAARPGAQLCEVSAEVAARRGIPIDVKGHRAHTVTAELAAGAQLILTAESSQRSHIAQLLPSARSRTFMLLEALELARLLERQGMEPVDDVATLTRALGRVRGLVKSTQVGLFRRRDSWELVDGHGQRRGWHQIRCAAVADAASDFAAIAGRLVLPARQ